MEKQELLEQEETRQDFAREQYNFLKNAGITGRMRRSRIFKAAGPGQVQEAWKLATSEKFEDEEGKFRKDLLLCLISGSKILKYSKEQIESLLNYHNFYIPNAANAKCFFRVLSGVGEILLPGFYRFNISDMKKIEDGLKKRIYEED